MISSRNIYWISLATGTAELKRGKVILDGAFKYAQKGECGGKLRTIARPATAALTASPPSPALSFFEILWSM